AGDEYKFNILPVLPYPFDSNDVQYQTTVKKAQNAPHVNVSVLVYTSTKRYEDHIRDLKFEGNFRSQCNLDFDCFFYQNHKHQITPDFFYSMDAVMLGMQAVHVLRADLVKINGTISLKTRKRDQIWVMHSVEPSTDARSWGAFQRDPILNQMFNWTIFLSRNATIHKKLFHIYKNKKNESSLKPWKDFYSNTNRSKDFCWIISSCVRELTNRRNEIAQSLIKSLSGKVHIWGHAIRRGCVNKSLPNLVDHGPAANLFVNYYDEPQRLTRDCKFSFAFENSNCSDFVTTRFINSIEAGAIPLVSGWWNTYRDLLPGSFIDVNEFANITEMAKYLNSLLKDEKKMIKYHEWRNSYRYERTGVYAACEMCQKLKKVKLAHLAGDRSNPTIIPNMAERFKSLQTCVPF
ncbi:4-galactosyl-N-acetylglucosaminide 3-alpha-L-fucosyltransferase FUT5-like, partial [Convolutriloba macropyga]|uniref:4-galactosyl-N-acetylglucosaminide 3-alpha-L-fucosyltransferase FUT5-like n=1 Tax=Convolutriloba macropyga TaxID=536237 RepID=UPI003F51C38E